MAHSPRSMPPTWAQASLALGPAGTCLQASPGGAKLAAGLRPRTEAPAVFVNPPGSFISQKAVPQGKAPRG